MIRVLGFGDWVIRGLGKRDSQYPNLLISKSRYSNNLITIIIHLFFFLCLLLRPAAAQEKWELLKGEHFLVYYTGDKPFAQNVLARAEHYYDKIASDLGYIRYDNFWQWDNRAKIYIYNTREDFIRETQAAQWAIGMAKYETKEIMLFNESQARLDSLLSHELTHLIFRDFVGFNSKAPLWLDEGVAQWEEESGKKEQAKKRVKELIRKGDFIPIHNLMRMDVRVQGDKATVKNFYAQAISLVGFLIEKYGGAKFTLFCRQLRDGKDLDGALSAAYTNSIPNVGVLQEKWVEYYSEY